MTKPKRRGPDWLPAALGGFALAALVSGGVAFTLNKPGASDAALAADPAGLARDRAYKAFQERLDGYRACRADADCVRVKADCACTGVSKARLKEFRADYDRTVADAGLSGCMDWPEPSCEDATSSPVCVEGACRVHVTVEDAAWDQ